MPIKACEVVEPPECRRIGIVMHERLNTPQDLNLMILEGADASKVSLPCGFGVVDRELEQAIPRRRVLTGCCDCCRVDRIVKGGPKVVEPLAHQHGHLWRCRCLGHAEVKAPITLMVNGELEGLGRQILVPRSPSLATVRFCTLDPAPARIEQVPRVSHLMSLPALPPPPREAVRAAGSGVRRRSHPVEHDLGRGGVPLAASGRGHVLVVEPGGDGGHAEAPSRSAVT